MRVLRSISPAILAVALAATPATAFIASNDLVVEQQAEGFNVPYRGESGARAFWCAAGKYAHKVLRQSPTATLYRVSEPPRRSGEGIAFSLSSSQSASRTGLANFGVSGGGLSIGHAISLCDDRFLVTR